MPRAGKSKQKAKMMAREGAYRKAVMSLQGGVKSLTPQEQEHWAKQLVPNSGRNGETMFTHRHQN